MSECAWRAARLDRARLRERVIVQREHDDARPRRHTRQCLRRGDAVHHTHGDEEPELAVAHKETLLRVMRCGASAYATKLTQGALMSLFPKFKRRDPLGASPEFGGK